jgi:hypothetical protein
MTRMRLPNHKSERGTLAARYRNLVELWIAPYLTERGFTRSKDGYLCAVSSLAWYIEIQRSRLNSKGRHEFTINCGVFIPGVVSAYSVRPAPQFPQLVDCSLYARIGMLSDEGLDRWWSLEEGQPAEADRAVGEAVQRAIATLAIPFFQRCDSRATVATLLTTSPDELKYVNPIAGAVRHAYAAIIYHGVGDHEKQRTSISKAVELARRSPLESHMAQLKESYG